MVSYMPNDKKTKTIAWGYAMKAFSMWRKRTAGPSFAILSIVLAFAYAHFANDPAATIWLLKLAAYATGSIAVLLIFVAQFDVWNAERIRKREGSRRTC